jgi:type I restriction enzyme, R subunit
LLEELLKDELKIRSKRNLVQSHVFSEKLRKTLNVNHNRAIATQEAIEELIKLAKELDAATKAGKEMGLTDDEKAFYDALAANDSAVTAMGDVRMPVSRLIGGAPGLMADPAPGRGPGLQNR